MEREEQYKALLEIVANARLLTALSDEDQVIYDAEKIKSYGVNAATALGYSEAKFKSDSITLYSEYLEKHR